MEFAEKAVYRKLLDSTAPREKDDQTGKPFKGLNVVFTKKS